MKLFLQWAVSAVAIWLAAYLVPGTEVTVPGALILAVVLGAINLLIRPILFVLTLPITILTLGLFSLVLNAFLVMLASAIVPDFSVSGFWAALFFSIVLTIINAVFNVWRRD